MEQLMIRAKGDLPHLSPHPHRLSRGQLPGNSPTLESLHPTSGHVTTMKICQTDSGELKGKVVECVPATGLPFFIIIITLVLCALLLATIALIIIIIIFRRRKKNRGDISPDSEHQINYSSLTKPLTRAMEVQPDLRNLEPRQQFTHMGPRKFLQLPLESQRRLITVPEEESGAEEISTESPDEMIEHVPAAELELEMELEMGMELEYEYEGGYSESAESMASPTTAEFPDPDQDQDN